METPSPRLRGERQLHAAKLGEGGCDRVHGSTQVRHLFGPRAGLSRPTVFSAVNYGSGDPVTRSGPSGVRP